LYFDIKIFIFNILKLFFFILLERTEERSFVLGSLETAMAELGAGVDEFQADLLDIPLLRERSERLS